MNAIRLFALVILTAAFAHAAVAQQQMPGGGGQPDQVAQLAEMLDLSERQQSEIRGIIDDSQGELQELQAEAQALQIQLQEQIGPDFNESNIREDATRLGELSGQMIAINTLMQARVDSVFTDEQRTTLEQRMQEMQQQQMQMQQQMQRQQMQ